MVTLTPSPNRAYLAMCLRHPAQIQPYGWTSNTLKTLGDIVKDGGMNNE
jgi:hypothetical protein